jgi:hypothetical protein
VTDARTNGGTRKRALFSWQARSTYNVRKFGRVAFGAVVISLSAGSTADASLSRNATGPKNMGEAGALTLDTALELEHESDDKAWLFETALQYEATHRLQLLLEAVVFERHEPDGGDSESGLGDTDLTLSWLAFEERGALPPVVFGARVKLPTAGEDRGTGKIDYAALLALGKEIGEWELNVETEYAAFGSPADEDLKAQFLYTIGVEYGVNDFLAVYAELFGNSAPTAEGSRTDAGLIGLEIDVFATDAVAPYLSLEMDTEEVRTARAGIEWAW